MIIQNDSPGSVGVFVMAGLCMVCYSCGPDGKHEDANGEEPPGDAADGPEPDGDAMTDLSPDSNDTGAEDTVIEDSEPEIVEGAYYVSPSGSDDNPGTMEQPWRTIQKAADTMGGGDTVYVRAGTYNERVVLEYIENASGPTMTFAVYPGEEAILDGGKPLDGTQGTTSIPIPYGGGLFHVWETDHVRVSGFKVMNSAGAGIYVAYSDHIEINGNATYNTYNSGIGIWGSSNVIVDGNDIELACYYGSEEHLTVDNSSYVDIMNNVVHDGPDEDPVWGRAGGEGINVKNGSSDVRVFRNTVHDLEKLAFGLDAWNNTVTTHDIEYSGNLAFSCYYGTIVSSEQGGTVENVKVVNNIAHDITRAGFSIPWWSGTLDGLKRNIQFINNTSCNNGHGFWIQSPSNENVVFENNILSQNEVNIEIVPEAVAQTTVDHNLFDGAGDTMGTNPVVGDPLFVDPDGADFHLQSGSPAIDAGSPLNAPADDYDGNPRPQGSDYDMGAFEYIGGG